MLKLCFMEGLLYFNNSLILKSTEELIRFFVQDVNHLVCLLYLNVIFNN